MSTARYDETHSPGARHAAAWLANPDNELKSADVLTLAAVAVLADAALFDPKHGYSGIYPGELCGLIGLSPAMTERRLDRLVRFGALEKRKAYADHYRYWIPEVVRLP